MAVIIQIQGDGESARRALEMVDASLHKTGNDAKREAAVISEAMGMVKSAMAGVGITLGLSAAIGEMKSLVTSSLDLGEQLERVSQKTGLSVESLSTLHYAAAVTGSDFDGLAAAVAKMDKSIGAATAGNKTALAFMSSLGLNAAELANRTDGAEIGFKKFAQTLAATESPIRRVQLATGLLGKAGAEQIPMLLQIGNNWDYFRQKAEAAGVQLNAQTAAALADTKHRMEDLEQHIQGAGLAFTEGLTPGITQMLRVISGGQSEMDTFKSFGEFLGYSFNEIAAVAYHAASGIATFYAVLNDGDFDGARKLEDQAHALQSAAEMIASTGFAPGASESIRAHKAAQSRSTNGAGFGGVPGPAGKSDDAIARAATALAEAQSSAQAEAVQAGNRRMLALIEEGHKAFLISDQDFYKRQLALEQGSIDAQIGALAERTKELQALYDKQHSDKLLKRDKSGNSAEELKTQTELVGIQRQLNDLAEKRATLGDVSKAAEALRDDEVRLATARMAAAVEEETNQGISARLALVRLEGEEERKRIAATAGNDSPEYHQSEELQRVKEAKLQIGDVTRQITETENAYKRAVDELNDAAAKDPRLKRAAQQQINELNAEEAKQLTDLVAQYDALAVTLGGPYLETAKNLHVELDKLNRPDQREEAQFGKTLVDGAEGMAKHLADAAVSGRESFHQMAQGIERDLLDLAIKLAEQQWITPMLQGKGAGLPSTAGLTGAGGAASLLGAAAPSLLGIKPAATSGGGFLSKLADLGTGGGDGGKGMSVRIMIDNATSQAVSARQTSQSFEPDLKEFVVHTVLENATSGGMLAHIFG